MHFSVFVPDVTDVTTMIILFLCVLLKDMLVRSCKNHGRIYLQVDDMYMHFKLSGKLLGFFLYWSFACNKHIKQLSSTCLLLCIIKKKKM